MTISINTCHCENERRRRRFSPRITLMTQMVGSVFCCRCRLSPRNTRNTQNNGGGGKSREGPEWSQAQIKAAKIGHGTVGKGMNCHSCRPIRGFVARLIPFHGLAPVATSCRPIRDLIAVERPVSRLYFRVFRVFRGCTISRGLASPRTDGRPIGCHVPDVAADMARLPMQQSTCPIRDRMADFLRYFWSAGSASTATSCPGEKRWRNG